MADAGSGVVCDRVGVSTALELASVEGSSDIDGPVEGDGSSTAVDPVAVAEGAAVMPDVEVGAIIVGNSTDETEEAACEADDPREEAAVLRVDCDATDVEIVDWEAIEVRIVF